jgi:N-acetylmuramoyl-L-alanine amidase
MNRDIRYIVVHCTATSPSAKVESIQTYWQKKLNWKNPGYHILIDEFGKCHYLLEDEGIANGVRGYNSVSVHVSYIGGIDEKGNAKDTRNEPQKRSLLECLYNWKRKYPNAVIQGHCDFPNVTKACPSFDAKQEYLHIK